MLSDRSEKIANYLSTVYSWLKDTVYLEKVALFTYRIEDYALDSKKGIILVIQLIGKNVFLKQTPLQIYNNKEMLNGFSPLDASSITELALQYGPPTDRSNLKSNKFLTLSSIFLKKNRQYQLRLGEKFRVENYSEEEIHDNDHIKHKINPIDLYRIAYAKGINDAKALLKKIYR